MAYDRPAEPTAPRITVDAKRLWAGGFFTAVVAALIPVVGILLARGVFKIPVLAPTNSGVWGDASTLSYALAAFVFGLVATGLMHALLLSAPSPYAYFGWIIGLITAVAVVIPFTIGATLTSKIATALINAVIGIAVGSLTSSSGRRSVVRNRPAPPQQGYQQPGYPSQSYPQDARTQQYPPDDYPPPR